MMIEKQMELIELQKHKKECLINILQQYKKANAGHIGASLSCLDILVYLFCHLKEKNDRFVLSKGHAALALYVVLAESGYIDKKELDTFYKNGTLLAAHPPCNKQINGIHFGTGSLGHGLSLATGFAFSNRFTQINNKVYCILSEGDLNEGSTWEAALFAAQHKLKNLYVIIDNNKLQGFGKSSDIINLEPIVNKWESFNFDVVVAEDGNNFSSLNNAFETLNELNNNKPKCIIAKTVKGKGISYMENKMEWHYLPMTDEQFALAMNEINR
jgi:transketolase